MYLTVFHHSVMKIKRIPQSKECFTTFAFAREINKIVSDSIQGGMLPINITGSIQKLQKTKIEKRIKNPSKSEHQGPSQLGEISF